MMKSLGIDASLARQPKALFHSLTSLTHKLQTQHATYEIGL